MVARKIALLFPGQGSQYPGMGKELCEKFSESREIFDQANDVMGFDIKSKIFSGTEDELKQTSLTQPAIFIVSCAAFNALKNQWPQIVGDCSFVAGHSLGEYSALFAAEVFDFQTGLKLVKYRGSFIQECCERVPGTMVAVLGIERNELQKVCLEVAKKMNCCEMVNFNSPGQIVVAGTKQAMDEFLKKGSSTPGYKAIPLAVSGAFHSSLMKEAAQKMSELFSTMPMQDAKIPVVANVDAVSTTSKAEIVEKLSRQIDHPVFWEDSVKLMISKGVETFIEIGPGKVLSGLLRKIDKSKKSLNVEDENSLKRALEELHAQPA